MYSSTTTLLKLPQWEASDKAKWLTDMNPAFLAIDNYAVENNNRLTTDENEISKNRVDSDNALADLNTKVTDLTNTVNEDNTNLTQRVTTLETDMNQLNNYTGNGIPLDTTAQTLAGAINELVNKESNTETVVYTNPVSGFNYEDGAQSVDITDQNILNKLKVGQHAVIQLAWKAGDYNEEVFVPLMTGTHRFGFSFLHGTNSPIIGNIDTIWQNNKLTIVENATIFNMSESTKQIVDINTFATNGIKLNKVTFI